MSTQIEIAGRFVFSKTASKFIFENGIEMDLEPMMAYDVPRQMLTAIMGSGFQELSEIAMARGGDSAHDAAPKSTTG